MNLEYKQKYLKYKNKYLSLKLELEGGKKTKKPEIPKKTIIIYHRFKNDKIKNNDLQLLKDKLPPLNVGARVRTRNPDDKNDTTYYRGTISENLSSHYFVEMDNGQDWYVAFEDLDLPADVYKKRFNNLIEDSAVKIKMNEGYYEPIDEGLVDLVDATFEYLEKKYGGRFEKGGVFKKGKHVKKNGKYDTHKSGMFSHYPEYFGELKPWKKEDIEAGKIKPAPILLDDNQSIFDKADFFRDTFLLGVTPFNGKWYSQNRNFDGTFNELLDCAKENQENARMVMINQIIKRLGLKTKPKNTDEWLKFLKTQKTSTGTYEPNIKYITDVREAIISFFNETKYVKYRKWYTQCENYGYEEWSNAFITQEELDYPEEQAKLKRIQEETERKYQEELKKSGKKDGWERNVNRRKMGYFFDRPPIINTNR